MTFKIRLILFVLLIPTLFLNLGMMPLLFDEGIRALVAFEMIASQNYVIPTINGILYFKKGPVFNWLIVASFQAFNEFSELAVRVPAVLSLVIFLPIIFFTIRKYSNSENAYFSAAWLVLSGSVLYFFSFLGHIDMFYSIIVFLQIFLLYHFSRVNKFWLAFLISYFLCAFGLFTKGLPSIVFQFFTIAYLFFNIKQWRKLFSLAHFSGIALFVLLVIAYFYQYKELGALDKMIKIMFTESTQRTVVENNLRESIIHFLIFPFKLFGWMLPGSIFIIYINSKSKFKSLLKDDWLKFCFWIVILNLIPYWLSPTTRSRYIFMLFPFAFSFIIAGWQYYRSESSKINKGVRIVFRALSLVLIPALFSVFFLEQTRLIPNLLQVFVIMLFLLLISIAFLFRTRRYFIEALMFLLIVVRLGFNLIVIPSREMEAPESQQKRDCIAIAEITKGEPLQMLHYSPIKEYASFYIASHRGEILSRERGALKLDTYYITNGPSYLDKTKDDFEVFYTFNDSYSQISLIKIRAFNP